MEGRGKIINILKIYLIQIGHNIVSALIQYLESTALIYRI